jgi:hypothetical protein
VRGGKCSFCGLKAGQYVNGCPKSDDHQHNTDGPMFIEYGMNSPSVRDNLTINIETVLTVTKTFVPPDGIHGDVAKEKKYKCSFVLQEIRPPESARSIGIGAWSLSQLVYLVPLI